MQINERLTRWLKTVGRDRDIQPYLWEEETEEGLKLSDRMKIQQQIIDTMSAEVPFTICIFGERCGVPLQDDLPPEWLHRLDSWRATEDRPGLVHPWPESKEKQARLLRNGCFPLTGTVFELISACAMPEDDDNLIIGYAASGYVGDADEPGDLFFNEEKEKKRLEQGGGSPNDKKKISQERYDPQVQGLFNLLKYLGKNICDPQCYSCEAEMVQSVVTRATDKLRDRYDLTTAQNPFKLSLEHWAVDDPNDLPGRNRLVTKVIDDLKGPDSPFVLITGPSGCGKSSVLQRGVLGKLQQDGRAVIATRPTELEIHGNRDRLDAFWNLICEQIEGCHLTRLVRLGRDKKMADHLAQVLDRTGTELVIGLDQFEEMLDEMNLASSDEDRSRGWWLLLRFLSRIAGLPQVSLVATLEAKREATFHSLDIEKVIGLRYTTRSAAVGPDDIEAIAAHGFELGRLPLDTDILQEIKKAWNRFTGPGAQQANAPSPLPLACLWLAELYEKFDDRAGVTPARAGGTAAGDMARAAQEPAALTLEDIGGAQAVAFEGIIARLADHAWRDARRGNLPEGDIAENAEKYMGLIAFLDPLVAMSGDGQMRLLSAPRDGGGRYLEQIFDAFIAAGLLVQAGRVGRVRLVHQAVIDRWPPAQRWYAWRREYLEIEREMRNAARNWAATGRKTPVYNDGMVRKAAQVLNAKRNEWRKPGPGTLSAEQRNFRRFCLAYLKKARNPLQPVENSGDLKPVITLAAQYHLTQELKRWIRADAQLLFAETSDETTLIKSAAFVDGPAVPFLLSEAKKHGHPEWARKAKKDGFHPIVSTIQEHATENFRHLLPFYDDVNCVVAPGERRMLHIAAMNDNTDAMMTLLDQQGVDLGIRNRNGFNAIDTAAYHGSERVFQLLLPKVAFLSEGRFNPLHRAAISGQTDIIRNILNSAELSEATIRQALTDKPGRSSGTPLMEAAKGRQPGALSMLLSVCDPTDKVHRTPRGDTMLHLLFMGSGSEPTADEEQRAKACVEILVATDGIDVMASVMGKTAYETGRKDCFRAARRILRQHMPLDYPSMPVALRISDLLSSSPREYRRLIEAAPEVLSDSLDGTTGIDLLIEKKRIRTLTEILCKGLAPGRLLSQRWDKLIGLASGKDATALREVLVGVVPKSRNADLSPLLDAALRAGDDEQALTDTLVARGVRLERGSAEAGMTVFHEMATTGDTERFTELAQKQPRARPRDDWGRVPSDLAAPSEQAEFAALEKTFFRGHTPGHRPARDPAPFLVFETSQGIGLGKSVRRRVLAAVRRIKGFPGTDAARTRTLGYELPFYRDTLLVEVTNPDWNEGRVRICFLLHADELIRLNGTSPAIHSFNTRIGLKIRKSDALSYLAFFCFFVRGDEGPFFVADRRDSPFIPEAVRSADFSDQIRPVRLWGREETTGNWRASACVYYSDALFVAHFLIRPGGMIEMLADEPVAADLPAKIDAPLGFDDPSD